MCDDVTYSYCFMQWQTIITYVTASLLDSDHAQGDLKQRQNMRSVTATHELGVWNVLQSKQKTTIFIIQLYYHNSSPRVPLYDFFCLPGPKGFEAFIVKNKHGAQKPNKYCSINFTNISFLNNKKVWEKNSRKILSEINGNIWWQYQIKSWYYQKCWLWLKKWSN